MLQTTLLLGSALIAVAETDAQEPEEKTRVAVMELRASEEIREELVRSLVAVIPQTLEELGPFKAISWDDVQSMLMLEKRKAILGCEDDASCLAEIGGAMGADYMVTGSVITVDDSYLLQLQLMSMGAAKVEQRVSREYKGGPAGLLDEVRAATKILVRGILAAKSGALAIDVSEEGATIKLDHTIIGVSPLAPLNVPGGLHTVEIEKEGFVLFSRDVEIEAKRATRLSALLVPSEEFKRGYMKRAGITRTLAWVGMGIGAAGLVTSGILFGAATEQADRLWPQVEAYNADPAGRTEARKAELDQGTRAVAMLDGFGLTMGLVGVAALGTGIALYIIGDDPDRYDASVDVGVEAPKGPTVIITPVGVGVAGTF